MISILPSLRASTTVLLFAALLFVSAGPLPAQQRGSVLLANNEAAPAVEAWFEAAGKRLAPSRIEVRKGIELVVRFSWKGAPETMGSVTLQPPLLYGVTASSPLEPRPAPPATARPVGERMALDWRIPLSTAQPGTARVQGISVEYLLAGFDRSLNVDAKELTLEVARPPSRWLANTMWSLGGLAVVFGLSYGIWRAKGRFAAWRVMTRAANPHLSSDDPSPFERVHAELATCEMKAQIEDFEAYFDKLRPLLYTFVAATEGPGVWTLSADELGAHFEAVGYDPKVGTRIVEYVKACERFESTHENPSLRDAMAMVKIMRQFSMQSMARPPRREG